jgi:glycosyltransferase involved in cell wall biosynthesis
LSAEPLEAKLDFGLPRELAIGAGTTLFLYGACWHPESGTRRLEVEVDGRPSAVEELEMPRRDIYVDSERESVQALDPEADWLPPYRLFGGAVREPTARTPSYRSGFWAFVDLAPVVEPTRAVLSLRATLADGRPARAELGEMTLLPRLERDPVGLPGEVTVAEPLVGICMATHDPDLARFEAQVRSIQAQTHTRWVCVISDDDSREELQREMVALVGDDPRFVLRGGQPRLGFFRNFERALAAAPAEADFIALSDQDDRWYPDKLETLVAAIDGHRLAFGDVRVVDEDGAALSETFFDHRPNNTTAIDRLLLMNTVTGAASLFRAELLDLILPFPPRIGPRAIHDQWIAAVALATGSVGYVDRPLHDYVQHRDSVLGHPSSYAEGHRDGWLERIRTPLYGQRTIYFGDYCRLQVVARTLLARCGREMDRDKTRRVERLLRLDSVAGLGLLTARSLIPKRRSASFGEERKLLRAVAWPPAVRAMSRSDKGRRSFDASMPEPIRDAMEVQLEQPPGIAELRQKTEPLKLRRNAAEPARINILIPGIDLRGFFGGYIGIFNLARKLSRGSAVRLVCFERGLEHLPDDWRAEVERFSGLDGFFDEVELTAGPVSGDELSVSPDDQLVATTWWSAHIADAATRELGRDRFLYLVQDYEPLFYPMSTWNALAEQTYSFPHYALFSTELLREFFRERRLGVFADGEAAGLESSTHFRNAITPVAPPTAGDLGLRRRRRLLFYARLESYSPRNLFDLGVLALSDLIADGTIDDRWELHGIGSVGGPARFDLGEGRELRVMPRQDEGSYADFLRKHDLGLSLMMSPHPSLVPLEMASAGMVTVTNSYANKTAAALEAISPNLVVGEPTREGLREALRRAFGAVDDVDARVAGANLRWPTDWDEALGDELIATLEGFLGVD